MTRQRIGLALGSGAARGWAHLGVLRALEEAGIQVDYVAGTSMGALVGAVFAAGRIRHLEEAALEMDWKEVIKLLDIGLRRSGLVDGAKIEAFVREHVDGISFADLQIPFAVVATDIYAAKEVILDEGDLIEAVRASISLPGIFTPVERMGRFLMDGGAVNPVPVSVARGMGADKVIAVDLNHALREKAESRAKARQQQLPKPRTGQSESGNERKNESRKDTRNESKNDSKSKRASSAWFSRLRAGLNERAAKVHPVLAKEIHLKRNGTQTPSVFEVLVTTLAIMQVQITEANLRLARPDLLIRPQLADFTFLEFNRAEEAIEAGYQATRKALQDWR